MVKRNKSYIYTGSRLLSTFTNNGSGEETLEFHHPDRLGTKLVTNNTANTSYQQSTLPFGTALNAESTGYSNQVFTSYDRSNVASLDYAVNRSYSSGQGRFTTVDPIGMGATSIGNPQSLNMYAYVENNPIDFVDPLGLLMSDAEFCEIALRVEAKSGWDPFGWAEGCRKNTKQAETGGGGGGQTVEKQVKDLAEKALKETACKNLFNLPNGMKPEDLLSAPNVTILFEDMSDHVIPDGRKKKGDALGTTSASAGKTTYTYSDGTTSEDWSTPDLTNPLSNKTVVNKTTEGTRAKIRINNNHKKKEYLTIASMAYTLIHELGHAADGMFGDAASALVSDLGINEKATKELQKKNREIMNNCRIALEKISGTKLGNRKP